MKKKFRIKKNEEFQRILNNRKFFAASNMVLYIHSRELNHARVGISVSKKLGKAVIRNKIKRQIRMMAQDIFTFNEPFDFIIMIRKDYLKFNYQENLDTLKSLVEKAVKQTGEKNEQN